MGRTHPSLGLPPAAARKDARAKRAKATLNKLIPSLLSAHPRARTGIAAAELITPDLLPALTPKPATPSTSQTPTQASLKVSLRLCDTLSAAYGLLSHSAASHTSAAEAEVEYQPKPDLTNNRARVAVLNMASPLSPGGGFLQGATSQEESLCMRTTLLPSLKDEWYRLPEISCIFTPDVLVFRDGEVEGRELGKGQRWFVDVVSSAALRQPEIEEGEDEGEEGRYAREEDREAMRRRMRLVMGVCKAKGVRRVVLGAWGCGAYGNPVGEVARLWRGVLLGKGRKRKGKGGEKGGGGGEWEGIEEVVFAVKDRVMAERFAEAFGEGLGVEEERQSGDELEDEDAEKVKQLVERIKEMELQAKQAKSPQLKLGLARAIAGLKEQLHGEEEAVGSRSDAASAEDDAENDGDDSSIAS